MIPGVSGLGSSHGNFPVRAVLGHHKGVPEFGPSCADQAQLWLLLCDRISLALYL
jgi:hypothetical protein